MRMKLDEIGLDEDVYPRKQISHVTVKAYADALKAGATFPPILVQKVGAGGKNSAIVIDGFHRVEAYKLHNGGEGVTPIEEVEVQFWRPEVLDKSEWLEALRIESALRNLKHGDRLKGSDLQFQALRIVADRPIEKLVGIVEELAGKFGVSKGWMSELIGAEVDRRKMSRDATVYRLGLLGWTQEEVGKVMGLTQQATSEITKRFGTELFCKEYESGLAPETIASNHGLDQALAWAIVLEGKGDLERFGLFGRSEYGNDRPNLYNVWNFSSRDPRLGQEWEGNVPGQIAMNVLYYYTTQGDLVVDPMAGGGSTVDTCLVMGRECRAYDNSPPKGRKDIERWDITEGFPKRAKGCDLIFLDPPYYKKKEKEYGPASVSALGRDDFLGRGFVEKLAEDCYGVLKKGGVVALLISDYLDYEKGEDSILAPEYYIKFKEAGFVPINHVSCPLSTEQWSEHDVERAKKNKIMLETARDIYIFKKAT